MSVPAGTAKVQYLGSGSTGPFAFNFELFLSSHLKATKTSIAGADTTLVLTTDYTVSIASDFSSAMVTLIAPLAGTGLPGASETLTLTRDPPISQLIEWPRNDPFPSSTHERAADLAVMLIDRLNEKISRSLLLPEGSSFSNLQLPNPTANAFLQWNASGTALQNMFIASPGTLIVSPFIQTLLDDVDAATARTTLGAFSSAGGTISGAVTVNQSVSAIRTTAGVQNFFMQTADDGATAGPLLFSERVSASPAVNDDLSQWLSRGRDSGGNATDYGKITNRILVPTDGSETSIWLIDRLVAGANVQEVVKAAGKSTIWIPGASLTTATGAAGPTANVFTAGGSLGLSYRTLDYDPTTEEYGYFSIAMPKDWDVGQISYQLVWSHAATVTNFGIVFDMYPAAAGDTDSLAIAAGSAARITDTGGTTNTEYISAESSLVTVGNTPAAGDVIHFRFNRVAADAGDNLAVDMRLHGIKLFYTTNAPNDR